MKRSPMSRNTTPMKRTAMLRRPPASKCRHCRKATADAQRLHPDCVEPWYEANREKIAKAKERAAKRQAKAERAADKAKLEEFEKLPKLIARAQTAFNAFIRERDKHLTCFVCDRPFLKGVPGRAMHAGHVRTRGAAGHLRFNEDNCHGECEGCNGPHGAKPHQIEAGAIRRIGPERTAALYANNTLHKWTKDEVRGIAATYRAKKLDLKKRST